MDENIIETVNESSTIESNNAVVPTEEVKPPRKKPGPKPKVKPIKESAAEFNSAEIPNVSDNVPSESGESQEQDSNIESTATEIHDATSTGSKPVVTTGLIPVYKTKNLHSSFGYTKEYTPLGATDKAGYTPVSAIVLGVGRVKCFLHSTLKSY